MNVYISEEAARNQMITMLDKWVVGKSKDEIYQRIKDYTEMYSVHSGVNQMRQARWGRRYLVAYYGEAKYELRKMKEEMEEMNKNMEF